MTRKALMIRLVVICLVLWLGIILGPIVARGETFNIIFSTDEPSPTASAFYLKWDTSLDGDFENVQEFLGNQGEFQADFEPGATIYFTGYWKDTDDSESGWATPVAVVAPAEPEGPLHTPGDIRNMEVSLRETESEVIL